jgi:hypothetical protein
VYHHYRYQHYRTFDQSKWIEHSVILPGKLAYRAPPAEITVMHYRAWLRPGSDATGLQRIYYDAPYDFGSNYAVHMWSASKRLKSLSRSSLTTGEMRNSGFARMVSLALSGYAPYKAFLAEAEAEAKASQHAR